ncbi:MAG TPA: universal stress protein [Candidatus Sulfotelmatobacter sp.]|nr:universal stress protein [Candidatus Sulfotelmatobacter sp.]
MSTKHLLFPTDFSDPAHHAGRYAAALARALGARVTILHVLLAPYPTGVVTPGEWLEVTRRLMQEEEGRAREALRGLMEGHDFRGISVRAVVKTGPVEHEVLQALRQDPVDVVVMGTHGRGLVGRAVLGGVTTKIVRLSPRPVLAVRWPGTQLHTPWGKVLVAPAPRAGGPSFARILVPLDGSPLAEGILTEVMALASPFHPSFLLVQVIERPAYPMLDVSGVQTREAEEAIGYLDRVRAVVEAAGFPARTEVLFGHPAAAILAHAAKAEADVIAMCTHGRSGLDRWLLGSVAEKVLSGSEIPVLLYRAWAEPS